MGMLMSDIEVSIIFGVCVLMFIFIIFSILRVNPYTRRFYCTRRFSREVLVKPKRLSPAVIGWLRPIWTYSEADIINTAGLDAAVYLRILSFGCRLFCWVVLLSCSLILPLNYTVNGSNEASDSAASATSNTTATNDNTDSTVVFTHGFISWTMPLYAVLLTTITFKVLSSYNKDIAQLRVKYLATQANAITHTVLLTDIPGMRQGTVYDVVQRWIKSTLLRWCGPRVREGFQHYLTKTVETATMGVQTATTVAEGLVSGKLPGVPKPAEGQQVPVLPSEGASSAPAGSSQLAVSSSGSDATSTLASEVPPAISPGLAKWRMLAQAIGDTSEAQSSTPTPDGQGIANAGATHGGGDGEEVSQYPEDEPPTDIWAQAQAKLDSGMSLQDMVRQELELVYGKGSVVSVNVVNNQDQLSGPVRRYKEARRALEDLLDHYAGEMRRRRRAVKRITVRVNPRVEGEWAVERYGRKALRLDALLWYPEKLQELMGVIEEQVEEARTQYVPTAFVTFKRRTDATIASTALHSYEERYWRMSVCPFPEEVEWNNLRMRSWERAWWHVLAWVLVLLVALLYFPAVAAVQSYLSLPTAVDSKEDDALLEEFPAWGYTVEQHPLLASMMRGVVPALLYKALLLPVPWVLSWLCRLSGVVSAFHVDIGVMLLFHGFQWFVTLAGSVLMAALELKYLLVDLDQELTDIEFDVSSTTSMVASSNTIVLFFMSYVVTVGLVYRPIMFLRLHKLALYVVRLPLATTRRARTRLHARQDWSLGGDLPEHTITIAIGLAFSIINPFISIIVLAYFVAATFLERYNILYVTSRTYESAGQIWAVACDQIVFGVYTMQLLLFMYMALSGLATALLLVPIFLASLWAHRTIRTTFRRPWSVLPLTAAAESDQQHSIQDDDDMAQLLDARQRLALITRRWRGLARGSAIDNLDVSSQPALAQELEAQLDGNAATARRRRAAALRRVKTLYVSPCFRVKRKQLERLLAEAARCDAKLQALEVLQLADRSSPDPEQGLELAPRPLNQSFVPRLSVLPRLPTVPRGSTVGRSSMVFSRQASNLWDKWDSSDDDDSDDDEDSDADADRRGRGNDGGTAQNGAQRYVSCVSNAWPVREEDVKGETGDQDEEQHSRAGGGWAAQLHWASGALVSWWTTPTPAQRQ